MKIKRWYIAGAYDSRGRLLCYNCAAIEGVAFDDPERVVLCKTVEERPREKWICAVCGHRL